MCRIEWMVILIFTLTTICCPSSALNCFICVGHKDDTCINPKVGVTRQGQCNSDSDISASAKILDRGYEEYKAYKGPVSDDSRRISKYTCVSRSIKGNQVHIVTRTCSKYEKLGCVTTPEGITTCACNDENRNVPCNFGISLHLKFIGNLALLLGTLYLIA